MREGVCRLPDGRRLGYAEYGRRDGCTILYFHGFPGSRLDAVLFHEAAAALEVRLIGVDRPGMGLSDFLPQRRIGDWPQDVAALADTLGLSRFTVLGHSGGAPYALACAARIPERLTGCALVAGLGPVAQAPEALARMGSLPRMVLALGRRLPAAARALYRTTVSPFLPHPELWMPWWRQVLPPPDQQVLDDPFVHAAIANSFKEAGRRGTRGLAWELCLYAEPWDFSLTDVGLPVRLWHGEADRTVPAAFGHFLAERLPRCEATFLPGEGHLSLPVHHGSRIVERLLNDFRAKAG